MNHNNISLCLFTSTKGHFSTVITYQETVESLFAQVPAGEFGQLLAHIKVSPGQESIGNEMEIWLRAKGFTVVKTIGEWSHGASMHRSYLKDLIKISQLVTNDYTLFLEDDMKIHINSKDSLCELIDMAKEFLSIEHEILEVRFPRFNNEIERLGNIKQKHGIDANVIISKYAPFFYHADNANFHPCIRRARDIFITFKIIEENLDSLSYNCEMGFSQVFKLWSRKKSCLACFYPEIVQCLHIGVKTPQERDIAGQTFDR